MSCFRCSRVATLLVAGAALWMFAGCEGGETTPGKDVIADSNVLPDALSDAIIGQDLSTEIEALDSHEVQQDTISEDTPVDDVPVADIEGDGATSDVQDNDVPSPPQVDPVIAASLAAIVAEHITFSADRGLSATIRDAKGAWWSGSGGVAIMQDGTVMEPDTLFRVGSNTKPFTAAVILQLVDEEKVGLDDSITDYVEDYPQWSEITIRQLLSMRSGIPDYLRNPALMLEAVTSPEKIWDPKEILDFVADDELDFPPGMGGEYTNSNYLLLGLVIEEVTGNTADKELEDRIIKPLGLNDTFLDMLGDTIPKLAHGYMDMSLVGVLFGVPTSIIDFLPVDSIVEGTIVDTTYIFNPSQTWMAGALVSTTRDMAVFVHALLTGDLISPTMLEEAKKALDITLLGAQVPYGLGLQANETQFGTMYGHGGLNFGYQAATYYAPDSQITVSHMHNFLPEQSAGFQNEIMTVLTDPPAEALIACSRPEGFFTVDAPDGLFQGRFKGPVNDFGALPRALGVGVMTQHEGEEDRPLYGIGVSSILKAPAAGKARVDIESLSPTGDGGSAYRLGSISLERDLLTELDETGDFTATGAAGVGRAYVLITDLWTDPETAAVTKMCFRTLSDFSKSTRLHVCETGTFEPNAGQILKIFVEAELLTDPVAIQATLSAIGLAPCLCAPTWAACDE